MNLSSAFFVTGDTDSALSYGQKAVDMRRNYGTLMNQGVILESQGKFETALPLAEEAHQQVPENNLVSCWYSDALIRLGHFSRARSFYAHSHADYRWMRPVIPEWDGIASLQGKRILLLSGGGYGDNILHSRWIPFLAAMGAHVTFMCPPSLHSLFSGQLGISRLIAGSVFGLEGSIIPSEYDYFINLYSLMTHFCPTPSDIPTKKYLSAIPYKSKIWPKIFGTVPPPKIGLCMRAGEEKFPRRHRSLNDAQRMKLSMALREYISLDNPRSDATWKETAEIIRACNLVITVDTGVAHLAGALNIPCWVILPGISAAYYGTRGDRCRFYPSHRLFRNGSEGIDNSVNSVCAALEAL